MEVITVEKLFSLCGKEINKGNGKKVIMISQDDEGNGYHYLWYAFTPAKELIKREEIDEDIALLKDTIILG